MIGKHWLLALAILSAAASTSLVAQTVSSGLRGSTPLNEEGPAAPMTPLRNTTEKEVRNYPEQPPVIPHTTEGYQIDINGNKCLSCHARARRKDEGRQAKGQGRNGRAGHPPTRAVGAPGSGQQAGAKAMTRARKGEREARAHGR